MFITHSDTSMSELSKKKFKKHDSLWLSFGFKNIDYTIIQNFSIPDLTVLSNDKLNGMTLTAV